MRIIAGRFKGQEIKSPKTLLALQPTALKKRFSPI